MSMTMWPKANRPSSGMFGLVDGSVSLGLSVFVIGPPPSISSLSYFCYATISRVWNLLLVIIMSAFPSVPVQAPQDDLQPVLQRATKYVTKYEEDLGEFIGSEEYLQNASWKGIGGRGLIARKMQRRTSSDF